MEEGWITGELTLLKGLKTLKGDLELVGVVELGWVVEDVDAQERYDRHLVKGVWYCFDRGI